MAMTDLAGVKIIQVAEVFRISGETFTAGMQEGHARAYSVNMPDGGILEVASTHWDGGDRDVRTITRLAGPVAYDRLLKGLRLGVGAAHEGGYYCELGITEHHQDRQPTVVKAGVSDLESMLDSNVLEMFESLGATSYGTREFVIGDTSRRRTYLAVSFPESAVSVPIAAYVLTRVLPIMKGFGRRGSIPVGQA